MGATDPKFSPVNFHTAGNLSVSGINHLYTRIMTLARIQFLKIIFTQYSDNLKNAYQQINLPGSTTKAASLRYFFVSLLSLHPIAEGFTIWRSPLPSIKTDFNLKTVLSPLLFNQIIDSDQTITRPNSGFYNIYNRVMDYAKINLLLKSILKLGHYVTGYEKHQSLYFKLKVDFNLLKSFLLGEQKKGTTFSLLFLKDFLRKINIPLARILKLTGLLLFVVFCLDKIRKPSPLTKPFIKEPTPTVSSWQEKLAYTLPQTAHSLSKLWLIFEHLLTAKDLLKNLQKQPNIKGGLLFLHQSSLFSYTALYNTSEYLEPHCSIIPEPTYRNMLGSPNTAR